MKIVFLVSLLLVPVISRAYESLPRACGTGYAVRNPQDDLIDAIKSHDISKVQAALQIHGVDVNEDSSKGFRSNCAQPLFIAIDEGQPAIIDLLIQKGADINAVVQISDSEALTRTPLMWAAVKGQAEVAKALLKYPQVRINEVARYLAGETALFLSVVNENYDITSLIANRPEVDVNTVVPRYSNRTPLLMLIGNAFLRANVGRTPPPIDPGLVAVLAQKSGTFINSDVPNSRPIRDAVWSKNNGIVDGLLTSKDLDVFGAAQNQRSGLEEAIWVDNAYAVRKIIARPELPVGLLEKYVTEDPIVSGLSAEDISSAFAALFESPSLDPNALDANGRSLLQRYAGQPDYIWPLLKNPKVDVNINKGGPLRAARGAYLQRQCQKNVGPCGRIALYIQQLESMGAQ